MIEAQETERAFLIELYHRTEGDPQVQVSMHEIGTAIGLDKDRAGKVAEEVIGAGWAEVRTLSGGIGITADGVAAARQAGAASGKETCRPLGAGPLLNDDDRQNVEALLKEVKGAVAILSADYDRLQALIIDIKTIEVQLLSACPKTAVVREVLRALQASLAQSGDGRVAGCIGGVIG
ncbi:MAG: hypothetical protein HKP58_00925 [Desulfatitalea sp.]|nr:hypothetical protein [Desulfatitalea sp.]NNJ98948.1 hypothetical protein [Desulfatitalea sp.]